MTGSRREGVREALAALAAGGVVVVADATDRENEGDLVCAADTMDATRTAFFLRHGSGLLCAPMPDGRAAHLGLSPMVTDNTELHGTAFTVTVDHADAGTGISAEHRALTLRALADPAIEAGQLRRPGHVFPLIARPGGVLKRAGHTEAAVDLLTLAGRSNQVAAITELVDDEGVPLAGTRLHAFAEHHDLPLLFIDELVRYRRRTESLIDRAGQARLPTDYGIFDAIAFRSRLDGIEHAALVMGDVARTQARGQDVLVRVHSECLTGDLFSSRRCDCGSQLHAALQQIADEGVGVLVYIRGHEGRGIGLGHKLQAYQLQDGGVDTVDANTRLGLPVDDREYGIGAAILADLGVRRVRLITNNPHKITGLDGFDLTITGRVASRPVVTADNIAYLTTKRDRLGHLLDLPPAVAH